MKKFFIPLIVLLTLLSIYVSSALNHPSTLEKPPATPNKSADELLEVVAHLDKMCRLTPLSGDITDIDRSLSCAESTLSNAQVQPVKPKDDTKLRDHQHALIPGQQIRFNVFVTKDAADVLAKTNIHFPLGSVVLKQKLLAGKQEKTILYTGMLKREPGFNPECGDWEFFTVSGDGKSITTRGKLTHCMECHKDYPSTDFVTKTYYGANDYTK